MVYKKKVKEYTACKNIISKGLYAFPLTTFNHKRTTMKMINLTMHKDGGRCSNQCLLLFLYSCITFVLEMPLALGISKTNWNGVKRETVHLKRIPGTDAAAAAAAKWLQSCPTLCDPTDGSPPGSPVPGISRQEHWSGVPLPSPSMH